MMTADAPALVNLTFWPVTWEDAGVLKCTGYNYLNQGQNATRAGIVTVLCSPKPVIINQFKYYVHKGQPALLIMNTNGCPSVQYTWTHNGIVLPQSRHVDGHWHSTVNISHTREADFGIYELNMSNPYGNYVQQYELIHAGEKNDTATSFKVAEGKDLDITCNATRSTGGIVYWTKNETKSTFRQNGTILRFVNIRRGASGDYICHLQTDHNTTIVKTIKVDVQYPAEIERFSLQPTTIKENETFSIVCKMAGNPDPVWSIVNNRSERQMMTGDAPALVNFTSWPVTWEDAGVWKCTGYNYLNQGQNVTRAGSVTVLCSPKPVIINAFKYYVHKGQPAMLIMNTNGCPSVRYTWTHNGIVLPQNRHVDGHWHSTVNISHTREDDFGTYQLNMSNPYGNYVQQYELIHAATPTPATSKSPYTGSAVIIQGHNLRALIFLTVLLLWL